MQVEVQQQEVRFEDRDTADLQPEQVIHFHHFKGIPATLCVIRDSMNNLCRIGVALVGHKDQFDRHKGRVIAQGRAEKQRGHMCGYVENERVKLAIEYLRNMEKTNKMYSRSVAKNFLLALCIGMCRV